MLNEIQESAQEEKSLASWSVDSIQTVLPASFVFFAVLILFITSFVFVFVIFKNTDLLSLVLPIMLFLMVISTLPEFIKSLKSISESSEVYITERGVYKRNSQKQEEYKFVAWDLMTGYDMKYLQSNSFLGKIFVRPTKFFIKSKYPDDSFWLDAFGDDVDILRAYLKEHNVPFGFLKAN